MPASKIPRITTITVSVRWARGTAGSANTLTPLLTASTPVMAVQPLVKERMALGWGISDYPAANGQRSIDNQFLMLAVTQGFVGMGLFLIIAVGSGIRLVQMAARPMLPEDRMLVYAHMAVLIGLMTTLTTVYMGEQVVMVFFLLIGWVQGMNPARVQARVAGTVAPQFRFRRVLS